jgi:hypothetical protein
MAVRRAVALAVAARWCNTQSIRDSDRFALTLNPSPEGRGTLNLTPFSLGRRVGDEGKDLGNDKLIG